FGYFDCGARNYRAAGVSNVADHSSEQYLRPGGLVGESQKKNESKHPQKLEARIEDRQETREPKPKTLGHGKIPFLRGSLRTPKLRLSLRGAYTRNCPMSTSTIRGKRGATRKATFSPTKNFRT